MYYLDVSGGFEHVIMVPGAAPEYESVQVMAAFHTWPQIHLPVLALDVCVCVPYNYNHECIYTVSALMMFVWVLLLQVWLRPLDQGAAAAVLFNPGA